MRLKPALIIVLILMFIVSGVVVATTMKNRPDVENISNISGYLSPTTTPTIKPINNSAVSMPSTIFNPTTTPSVTATPISSPTNQPNTQGIQLNTEFSLSVGQTATIGSTIVTLNGLSSNTAQVTAECKNQESYQRTLQAGDGISFKLTCATHVNFVRQQGNQGIFIIYAVR